MKLKIKNRITKLIGRLGANDIEGILISRPENRRYLSGFDGSAGFLFITPKDSVLATDFRYTTQAKSQAPDYKLLTISGEISQWFPPLINELGIKRLGFESEHIAFAQHQRLCDILNEGNSQAKLIPVDGVVESLRALKEPEEIELMTRAAGIADAAINHIREKLHVGMTELEAAWEIEKFMREAGSQPVPFEIIVGSGPNAALPHALPTERAIGESEPIVIDIGARVEGYGSDLSRTFCLGAPDETFKKVYDTVLGARDTAIAIIKEGMNGAEADQLARTVIEEGGYGEAFGHGLGHGVGLAPHESPRLGPNSTDKLADSMVFTIEPGIYLEGWGGVRIEDMVVMEGGKLRQISSRELDSR
ncbi:MAG: M24 family metallopeptidase [Dehalococcoidia bacterium]|nr:MAG: M24 family metallopeptidase [Dehalococcoidia bacterium]